MTEKPGAPEVDPDFSPAPEGAKFNTLKDGSTSLVVPAGVRLKLDLNDLTSGGDDKKASRKAKAKAAGALAQMHTYTLFHPLTHTYIFIH